MPLDAEIYERKDALGGSFTVSLVLHAALLAACVLLPSIMQSKGDSWGGTSAGGGEAMSANLVTTIPLPANPQARPENVLATENKGLSQSAPVQQTKEDEKAIAIPDKNVRSKKQPPAPPKEEPHEKAPRQQNAPTRPMQEKPREMAKLDNTVPYGAGGPVSGPYSMFSANGVNGGLKVQGSGSGAGGDFGSRYAWYVDAVRRKVSQSWYQYEIDPRTAKGKRAYLVFDIMKDGSIRNPRMEQSSGVPSLDQSAIRALQRIDTFGPLPQGYNGSSVSVEYYFEH